ncbi:hypothetical protein HZS_963 [Henneguya salminicola]|nr:hypothetical protein HZS_963 [Henneguya salminicola]
MTNKAYNISFKLKAVSLAKKLGNRPAASQLGVYEKPIRKWRLQVGQGKFTAIIADLGEISGSTRQRLPGGRCKPAIPDVEDNLTARIHEQLANFIKFCGKLRQDFKLLLEFIEHIDETAIWADMPSNSSMDHRGVKTC